MVVVPEEGKKKVIQWCNHLALSADSSIKNTPKCESNLSHWAVRPFSAWYPQKIEKLRKIWCRRPKS